MEIKCRVSTGTKSGVKKAVLTVEDLALAGLDEDQKMDLITDVFNKWLKETIDADWEIVD